MKRSTIIELCAMLGLFVVVTIVWARFASSQRDRMTPKAGTTFHAFAKEMPPPKRLAHVDDNSGQKIVWVGETALLSLLAGSSCYVFDDKGNLIRYNLSTGDGETTTDDVNAAYKSDEISIDEAKMLLVSSTTGP